MKKIHFLLGVLLFVCYTYHANAQVSNDNEDEVYKIDTRTGQQDYVPGQVLVKFKDESPVYVSSSRGMFRSASISTVDAVLKEFGVETMDKLLPNEKPKPVSLRRKGKAFNGQDVVESDLSQLYIVKMNSLRQDSTLQLVKKLQELDGVEFAEPNYKVYMLGQVPTPSMSAAPAQQAALPRAYSKEATGDVICADPSKNPLYTQQWGITKLKVNELWNKTIINKKRPVIAILDTGVDITHPDLADNIWTNQKEAEGEKNYDNDGNGFKGDVHGWDFINNTSVIRDYNSHGTHVAGIAAACDNEIGIVGANPQALIMPITVMQSNGTGDVAVIAKGIQYAIDNGADIINMSLGTYYNSYTMKQVLEHAYQNAVIVAAAGNDAFPMTECGKSTMYPAGYSFVLGVQSGQDGNLDGFSNIDCNGPAFSLLGWDIQENYELIAPGSGIISCIPYGKYKKLTGTSMSAPLVAGGISALKMVKEYDTQEILWADLIHMDCNFLKTFNVSERPAEIEIMTLQWNDTEDGGNGDGFWDAGETIRFYPVVRTVWGDATNVKAHLEIGEYEDASLIEIIKNDAKLGMNLSTYAHHQFTEPIIFKISENCADARHIKLKLTITCDEAINSYTQEFVITVDNIVKLAGLIQEDYTLTPSHRYLISEDVAVTKGVNLTIEPGTNIVFREGTMLSVFGVINAHGKPGEMITFSRQHEDDVVGYGEYKINLYGQTVSYCHFKDASEIRNAFLENCIIQHLKTTYAYLEKNYDRCNYIDSRSIVLNKNIVNSNIVNNTISTGPADDLQWSDVNHSNYFNNVSGFPGPGEDIEGYYVLKFQTNTPSVDKNENPGYLGTSRSDLVIPHIYQMGYPWRSGFGETDLSNMLTEPVREAHGIVWKVLIDGVDPQDEYEIMPVLGVGRHKFEVYFNRPMNKAKIPNVGFGVRSPYNQNMVDEEGPGSGWNADGTIYTVYKTITGKTQSDGRNRVYIWGAEDDEFFECPYENFRFRFDIQSAGTMATGLVAESQMGRVNLTWNNENNDFEDAMGFNIYRYSDSKLKTIPAHSDEDNNWIEETQVPDTICINKELVDIETTEYTDYDVTPGETYYYMYKVLSTDLKEYDVSNVVAATPLTSQKGDANGDNSVSVPDVISTVNYILGENPKPFIFEAADMNTDQNVDVLDVIGIIQAILNQPSGSRAFIEGMAQAVYTIEDGILYIETPIALSGIQLQVSTKENVTAAETLKGFEVASTWLTENDYRMLAYSFGSKTLAPGKHAIMTIGNADLTSLRLADTAGNSVLAVPGEATLIKDAMGSKVMTTKGVWNLSGQKVSGNDTNLRKGVYIIDGQKIVK